MSIVLNKAICLHAQADDLAFLNPVRNRMQKLLGGSLVGFSFGDKKSTIAARAGLEASASSFVVILAHGGRDYLRGGEYTHRVTRETLTADRFLTKADLRLFNNKVVFCLSCDSNGLAESSLIAGAKAFVGFDAIPFNRYNSNGDPICNGEFVHHAQRLIALVVQSTIERFLSGVLTLDEAIAFMRLHVCQEAIRFTRLSAKFKPSREVSALLLHVKDGVRYYGDSSVRFAKDLRT